MKHFDSVVSLIFFTKNFTLKQDGLTHITKLLIYTELVVNKQTMITSQSIQQHIFVSYLSLFNVTVLEAYNQKQKL